MIATETPNGGSLDAVFRHTPWTQDEDDMLRYWYGCANGAMTPYRHMAEYLNKHFHGGKPIRKVGAIARRDGKINYGK